VYKSTVKAIVAATRKLNMLCAAPPDGGSGFPDMSNLPSWAPDWTRPWKDQGLLQHKILYPSTQGINGGDFTAAKTSDAVANFSDNLDRLQVKGIVIDRIDEIWPPLTTKMDGVDSLKKKFRPSELLQKGKAMARQP
jgi:hypothetical protein